MTPAQGKATCTRKWGEMEKLRPEELSELIEACPVVYVPSGIYEWHDAQNPLGTDTLKVAEMAKRTARLTGGVVHMPSYVGVGTFYGPLGCLKAGGLNFSEELVEGYLKELCAQLEGYGFRMIVLLYGHTSPGNADAHDRAALGHMTAEGTTAKVLSLNDLSCAVKHRYKVADHAAKWETSFMQASHPERVCMEAIPEDHGGWWGLDPREHASASEGERMYDLVAGETARFVELAMDAPREQLIDFRFPRTRACWEDCQNVLDLADDFWRGDAFWEDPWCWFCRWRSPGVVGALVALKGREWMGRMMETWREAAGRYDGSFRAAMEALEGEWRDAQQETA